MKKSIKNKKPLVKRNVMLILVTSAIVASMGGYLYYQKSKIEPRDPGFEPLVEYSKYLDKQDKQCPLLKLYSDSDLTIETKDFKVSDVICSAESNNVWKIKEGEEAEVEIYTQDIEVGKAKFRSWLKSQGLEESDKLRITYEHRPK